MTGTRLSADTLFGLLKNRRRRYLLYCLDREVDSVVTLDELSAMVRDGERYVESKDHRSPADPERRIRISLHHNHLPRLADAGVVEYDARSQTVRNSDPPSVGEFREENVDELPVSGHCSARR